MTTRRIQKLLIANRGEIALRVIRACKELGIASVAVYSDVDRKSLHVLSADEAYALGGSIPRESYLNQGRIIDIAKAANADAIHPGYGFLAENPSFADAVVQAGIIFVGPSGSAIRSMGDKTSARKIARQLGVPTISGTLEPLKDATEGLKSAAEIGFPVLLKAVAGGGGKGMRVVQSAEEFESSYRMVQSEAKGAFGDERVYVEKFLDSPRHIEVQIIGDAYGNVIHLGERECSIQRRHQKVIEESPSTAVTEELRRKLGETAVLLAKCAQYVNAGTMEFLLDSSGKFCFLEMNTRLQVEHPVTEEVTGIDLVKLQIQIAEGYPLSYQQEQVRIHGHAIECRICAEDPENDFMPSTGLITHYRPPQGRIRVENGFQQGDELSLFYDSLMAKVISWGSTRDEAIARMQRALSDFSIGGVSSTLPFCLFVLRHKAFIDGLIDIRFVEKYFNPSDLSQNLEERQLAAAASAALLAMRDGKSLGHPAVGMPRSFNKWRFSRVEKLR